MLTCAVAAICIDLGNFHQNDSADGFVPVLSSLYRWTPFYWGANRFGLLLPLVAMPFSHPLTNLLVQTGLSIFSGLSVLFLLPRHLMRDAHWPETGTALAVLYLLFGSEKFRFLFLTGAQSWAPSLALSVGGMILLEEHGSRPHARWRFAGALALMLLGHWVNPMPACIFIPLVVARHLWGKQVHRVECLAIVSALGPAFLASFTASLGVRMFNLYPLDDVTNFEFSHPRLWIATWWTLAVQLYRAAGPLGPALLAVTLVLTIVAGRARGGREAFRKSCRLLPPLLLATAAYAGFTGSLVWVENQTAGEAYRFWFPALFLGLAGLTSALWTPAWHLLSQSLIVSRGRRRFQIGVSASVMLCAAILVYGPPSLKMVRRDIDVGRGHRTAALRSEACTHIVGDYGKVWSSMFHANLVAYERGESRFVWGDSLRAGAIRHLWQHMPPGEIKLAIASSDRELHPYAMVFDLQEMSRKQAGAIDVLEPPGVFLIWMQGFIRDWPSETDRLGSPPAELWICNRTGTPQMVTMEMDLSTKTDATVPLVIATPWFNDRPDLEVEPVMWRRTFVVPPGRHRAQFNRDNLDSRPGGRAGRFAWRVGRPRVATAQQTADSSNGSNVQRSTVD
jgi:hypothetical protein